mgnify:CR=1 FL=1
MYKVRLLYSGGVTQLFENASHDLRHRGHIGRPLAPRPDGQFAVAQPRIKLPIRARGQRAANVPAVAQVVQGVLKPLRHPRAVQHLAGRNAGQGFGQLRLGAFGQVNAPCVTLIHASPTRWRCPPERRAPSGPAGLS